MVYLSIWYCYVTELHAYILIKYCVIKRGIMLCHTLYVNRYMIIIQLWEDENPVVCNNMDITWENYAEWNKADRRAKCFMVALIHRIFFKSNLQKQRAENKLPVDGVVRRTGGSWLKGTNIHVSYEDQK